MSSPGEKVLSLEGVKAGLSSPDPLMEIHESAGIMRSPPIGLGWRGSAADLALYQ